MPSSDGAASDQDAAPDGLPGPAPAGRTYGLSTGPGAALRRPGLRREGCKEPARPGGGAAGREAPSGARRRPAEDALAVGPAGAAPAAGPSTTAGRPPHARGNARGETAPP